MKTRIVTITALICSILSCAAADWTETNGLAVRVTVDRSILRPGDTLQVIVEIQNTSSNALVIHRIPNPWEWLIVADGKGKEYPSYPNLIAEPLSPSSEQFIQLAPGAIHTGTLSATLAASHSTLNANWNPRFMKLATGVRDYDLPEGIFAVHYLRRESPEEQLSSNGEWRPFASVFPAPQWIGEIRSTNIMIEAKGNSQPPPAPRTRSPERRGEP